MILACHLYSVEIRYQNVYHLHYFLKDRHYYSSYCHCCYFRGDCICCCYCRWECIDKEIFSTSFTFFSSCLFHSARMLFDDGILWRHISVIFDACTQITDYWTGVYYLKSKLREKSSHFSYHEITLNFSLRFSRFQSHVVHWGLTRIPKILC